MKSVPRGSLISKVEVTNISANGLWVLLSGRELFLSFDHFPWFREAPFGMILKVQAPSAHHLYWPDLDVDIAVESVLHPERYPLVSKVAPTKRAPRKQTGAQASSVQRP